MAQRLTTSQQRIIGVLAKTLTEQAADLLPHEALDGQAALSQMHLAAMLVVQRPRSAGSEELERRGLFAMPRSTFSAVRR